VKTSRNTGSTTMEFALVLLLFLTFLLGVMDFSRMLFTWNAAAEATRAGARYATVCHDGTDAQTGTVLSLMQAMLPQIASIEVTWYQLTDETGAAVDGCTPQECDGVRVSVTGLNYQWISPVAGIAALAGMAMPDFTTDLPRESMRRDVRSAELCTL